MAVTMQSFNLSKVADGAGTDWAGAGESGADEAGFVVPYVLVMVGILALITVFAMERLSRTIETVERIDAVSQSRLDLHSAAQETLFAVLTASQNSQGFDLAGGVYGEAVELGGRANPEGFVADIWVPNGQWRRTDAALVALRDAAGLLPLNTASWESLNALLQEVGVPATQSKRLVARLEDYKDPDDLRREAGGEAPAYRRTDRPEPSNRPIRSIVELGNILDWDTEIDPMTRARLADFVTLSGSQIGISDTYAHPVLQRILSLSEDNRIDVDNDEFSGAIRVQSTPSNRTRLTIVVGHPFPRVQQIEIEKTIANVEQPFRTYFISEFAISPSAYDSLRREAGDEDLIKRVTPAASR